MNGLTGSVNQGHHKNQHWSDESIGGSVNEQTEIILAMIRMNFESIKNSL